MAGGAVDIAEIKTEIKAFTKLSGHAHIVRILEWRRWQLMFFIDMELCDVNLHSYIQSQYGDERVANLLHEPVFVSPNCSSDVRLHNTCTILDHICRGVVHIHQEGYSHRDLKPANGKHFKGSTR
jgi:serine/threonine protein kinase